MDQTELLAGEVHTPHWPLLHAAMANEFALLVVAQLQTRQK
jgi:hypothetical protein